MNNWVSPSEIDIVGSATSAEDIISALSKRGCSDLTQSIDLAKCSTRPLAGGGFCDVYRGSLKRGTKIAIKSLRIYDRPGKDSQNEKTRVLKRTARELYHWSKLSHPNVLPLMGLAVFQGHMSMISRWMDHGDLMSYVRLKPDTNRTRLCMDVCKGLLYIHANEMVHGDLKAANVMVSSEGAAMIADFGNSQLKDLTLRFTNTNSSSFSVRWAAPELLLAEDVPRLTKKADVYAYGMTMLETLTGKIPFERLNEHQVMRKVAFQRATPVRESDDPGDGLWEVMQYCWTWDESARPEIISIKELLDVLCLRPLEEPETSDLGVPLPGSNSTAIVAPRPERGKIKSSRRRHPHNTPQLGVWNQVYYRATEEPLELAKSRRLEKLGDRLYSFKRPSGTINHGMAHPEVYPPQPTNDNDQSLGPGLGALGLNLHGFSPMALIRPFPELIDMDDTDDWSDSSRSSAPSQNTTPASATNPKLLSRAFKRTLSIQNSNLRSGTHGRSHSQENIGNYSRSLGRSRSRTDLSSGDNLRASGSRSALPVPVQPLQFGRTHPFSMTSPHTIEYGGKDYPSAIHLWHALRFLKRPAKRGGAEEDWQPGIAENIRQAIEPELQADLLAQMAVKSVDKDGRTIHTLQRPDWEVIQMEKMDEVLTLKFTQHPSLGQMLMSTHPTTLLYMWGEPWGAGNDLNGPNIFGRAVMRCRDHFLLHHRKRT